MNNYVFFLGGYDAEMLEIKSILQSRNELFYDKGLAWGAALSSYKDEIANLTSDVVPVFIELKIDCAYPENSIFIDHHDEKANFCHKTSIDQVADLLELTLNRHQQLISANDRGHIRAMREMSATNEEITKIRTLDRRAQGVTDEDERLAEASIESCVKRIGNKAIIVHSLTVKTSPVFDRLYDKYDNIFVFTPDGEMNYSGTGAVVNSLVEIYKGKQKENPSLQFWYGGNLPESGFFGSNQQMDIEEIKNMLIKSQHIFLFPFRIVPVNEGKKNENTGMNIYEIIKSITEGGWEYKPYKINTGANYSEYYYFHEYVRKSIFEQQEFKEFLKKNTSPDFVSCHFERPVPDNSTMHLYIKGNDNGKPACFDYNLTIHQLSLKLFFTEIGILTIELYNYDYPELEEILRINEYGRRIYPQFLPDNCDINFVKNNFLADRIEFKCGDIDSKEDFSHSAKFLNKDLIVADYILKLLGGSFTKTFCFVPIIDDRMFTVCWYANAELIEKLKTKHRWTSRYTYEASDDWNSFVLIDGYVKKVSAGGKMKEDLIKQFTYSRWIHMGTLYGITRYSLMCLTNASVFSYNVLRPHMERMYYQIAIILLAQRASILKFFCDISKISKKLKNIKGKRDREELEKIADDVKNLHSSFIHFVNRLWFAEVTPQEQGIEMYNMAIKNMSQKEQLEQIRQEIKELYEFVDMQYEKEISRSVVLLDKIASFFLPVVVGTSVFSAYFFTRGDIPFSLIGRIGMPMIFIIAAFLITLGLKWYYGKKRC